MSMNLDTPRQPLEGALRLIYNRLVPRPYGRLVVYQQGAALMIRWEYLARTFEADKNHEVVMDYLRENYPETSWKELPDHDVLTLEAWLSEWGRHGWELVSCALADKLGQKGDLGYAYPTMLTWRKVYVCVFKRPKAE